VQPVIFLDIDGVVLTGRAWRLPENVGAIAHMKRPAGRPDRRKNLLDALRSLASFDTEAIALVTRLAERTNSRIVISSNWRKTVGPEFAYGKLIARSIPERLFHDDWHTPLVGSHGDYKAVEISRWLAANRLTPTPTGPAYPPWEGDPEKRSAAWQAAYDTAVAEHDAAMPEYHRAYRAHGIEYVVLEDEPDGLGSHPVIECDFDSGFTAIPYAVALRTLGGLDPEMGVHAIEDADWARILMAFDGSSVAAAKWLQSPHGDQCPAAALGGAAEARTWFWERLAEDTKPWTPEPLDNNF
jgi:HAD domain in Swiss Army Knife RNA repair proteins